MQGNNIVKPICLGRCNNLSHIVCLLLLHSSWDSIMFFLFFSLKEEEKIASKKMGRDCRNEQVT